MGLKATRITIASPLLMPPWIPPELFVAVRSWAPSLGRKASLCSLPLSSVPPKPEPISKPFVAGSDITALARSASSLSNTGIPSPTGGRRTTHSITPPQESPSRPIASIRSTMRSAMAGSGQRTMFDSTASRVTRLGSIGASRSWMRLTQASTSVPWVLASSCLAIAPAATRPMVSRAEARPPPLRAWMPYLAW